MTNSWRLALRRKCLAFVFAYGLWRVAEADGQPVVGIHQADRDREIDQFLFLEDRARGLERFIRHAGLRHAGHRLGPGKRRTLTLAEEMARFRPRLHQRELLDLHTLLDEVAGVHVEAIGTVVDLRDTQIDEVNQLGGKAALHDIAIDAAKGLYAVRSDLVVIETHGHCASP